MNGEDELLDAVANVGPVSVAVEADQDIFQLYDRGVLQGMGQDGNPCGRSVDHGVLVVGYGTTGKDGSGTPYWKVKNSWGYWGEAGYLRIRRGSNECGIATELTYPTVDASVPVPPPPATHYAQPPCQNQDEVEVEVNGGKVCAAMCATDAACPWEGDGVKATRRCGIEGMKGFCSLQCGHDSGCPEGAKCMKKTLHLEGVCAFPETDIFA